MGLEILRHCPAEQRRLLHAIFVPIGGGGMAAGIAALIKAVDPSILVIGVEPTGVPRVTCLVWASNRPFIKTKPGLHMITRFGKTL